MTSDAKSSQSFIYSFAFDSRSLNESEGSIDYEYELWTKKKNRIRIIKRNQKKRRSNFVLLVLCGGSIHAIKMVSFVGFGKQIHQTIAALALVIVFNNSLQVHGTPESNQNQVIENLSLLSQNDDSGIQPSRLRALLVNDLRNILVKNVR